MGLPLCLAPQLAPPSRQQACALLPQRAELGAHLRCTAARLPRLHWQVHTATVHAPAPHCPVQVAITEAAPGAGQLGSVKYLSSPRLLTLQLRDATFRRHFLLQCLILMQARALGLGAGALASERAPPCMSCAPTFHPQPPRPPFHSSWSARGTRTRTAASGQGCGVRCWRICRCERHRPPTQLRLHAPRCLGFIPPPPLPAPEAGAALPSVHGAGSHARARPRVCRCSAPGECWCCQGPWGSHAEARPLVP